MRLPLFIVKTAGTKSWFIPLALEYLSNWCPTTIVEPFAGSGIVGLTLLHAGFAKRLVLAENDKDYLAFWHVALSDPNFSHRVSKWTELVFDLPFNQQRPFVEASLKRMEHEDRGFWTLLRTRLGFNGKKVGGFMTECNRGGILCRWPRTLDLSLDLLYKLRNKITIMENGFEALAAFDSEDSYAFADPTYTVTKACPGNNQYKMILVDHPKLVSKLGAWKGRWQLTYNLSPLTIIPSLYQLCLAGRADIDFPVMLSGSGNGGSREKFEMLVSKISGLRRPDLELMENMIMTTERHRDLLRLSMPRQRLKRLVWEETMYSLAVLRKRLKITS